MQQVAVKKKDQLIGALKDMGDQGYVALSELTDVERENIVVYAYKKIWRNEQDAASAKK